MQITLAQHKQTDPRAEVSRTSAWGSVCATSTSPI